jgi:photosynthetic reaction center cytochrome c subunit
MRLKRTLAGICVSGIVLFSGTARLWTQAAQQTSSVAAPRTAEQVYKNIQVLKGVPADQLIPAMQFITASLGVQCDFCHDENAFEKDDKENKQTARKMMRMMFGINKDNFDGHREVTCYACHRGQHKPVAAPTIVGDDAELIGAEDLRQAGSNDAGLPSAGQILGKYLQAVGGADAASRISTRVQEGTLTVGSEHFPVEIIAKGPSKRVTTVHFPGGDSVTGVNGDEGWLSMPARAIHDMSPAEADAAKMDAELFFPGSVRQIFKELCVKRKQQVSGHEDYVVLGVRDDQPPVQLYFDEVTGLLMRVLRFTETPLGLLPTQIDYGDYRQKAGPGTAFRWTIARPGGRFTIQIERMQENVQIDDGRFVKPASINK